MGEGFFLGFGNHQATSLLLLNCQAQIGIFALLASQGFVRPNP